MKKNSSIVLNLAVAAVYFGLLESLQAAPVAPNVPAAGSTGLMLAFAISGIGFLKLKLRY